MSKYMVVVDMQNDFITGSLGTPEAQAILPKVIERIKEFPGSVVFTMDTHDENYLETYEGKRLPIEHCIDGTEGWEMPAEIREMQIERRGMLFRKNTFGSTQLGGFLQGVSRMAPIDEVIIVGLCTDICVLANAMMVRTALPDTPVTVDATCCAGSTPEAHRHALEAMKSCQIDIIE